MEKVAILVENNQLLSQITDFIMLSIQRKKIKFDSKSPLILNGISFWLENDKNAATFMVYNSNPATWSPEVAEIIKNELLELEYNLYRELDLINY